MQPAMANKTVIDGVAGLRSLVGKELGISDYRILTITVTDERVREIVRQNRLLDLSPDDLDEAEAQGGESGEQHGWSL